MYSRTTILIPGLTWVYHIVKYINKISHVISWGYQKGNFWDITTQYCDNAIHLGYTFLPMYRIIYRIIYEISKIVIDCDIYVDKSQLCCASVVAGTVYV